MFVNRDLLDSTRTKNNLPIREDKVNGIHVGGVTEEYVTSQQEVGSMYILCNDSILLSLAVCSY